MRFVKGHGTGNDFVLFADVAGRSAPSVSAVRAIADRHRGIGADGVIRAVPTVNAGLADALCAELKDVEATWFMDYRNADGSIAEMCGNGVRVFVDFLIHEDLIELSVGESINIGTRAGAKGVQRVGEHQYAVNMGTWQLTYPQLADDGFDTLVTVSGDVARRGVSIDMGNPHVVVMVDQHEALAQLDLSVAPTLAPSPQEGANVEFVVINGVDSGNGSIAMRVFERGVGETLSCGTGACAAALAVRFWAGDRAPDRWDIGVPGGVLELSVTSGEMVTLAGPSELVAVGETDLLDAE